MGDEAYIQIMKQLTNNPKIISRRLGWKLLSRLIAAMPPNKGVSTYLQTFIIKDLQYVDNIPEDKEIKFLCLKELNTAIKSRVELDTPSEAKIPTTVRLLDRTRRVIEVAGNSTIEELTNLVVDELGLKKQLNWCM